MADGNLLGGGVVVALAAGLWLVYLIPTWLRRREFWATERNAVRLQQTLRILAEAAEVPEEIHVEATAKDVAEQQRALRKVQARAAAEAKERAAALAHVEEQQLAERRSAAEAQERAEQAASAQARAWAVAEARARVAAARERTEAAARKARAAGAVLPMDAARGIRRGRMLATGVLLAGVIVFAIGAVLGWMLVPLVVGAVLVAGSVAMLARFAARVSAARAVALGAVPARRRGAPGALYDHAAFEAPALDADDIELEATEPWTPQPLPRPLHLSRGTIAASTMASITAAAELRRVANRAALEERAEALEAERSPLVAKLRAKQEPELAASTGVDGSGAASSVGADSVGAGTAAAAADSVYARMGVVGESAGAGLDLDAALARRRAV